MAYTSPEYGSPRHSAEEITRIWPRLTALENALKEHSLEEITAKLTDLEDKTDTASESATKAKVAQKSASSYQGHAKANAEKAKVYAEKTLEKYNTLSELVGDLESRANFLNENSEKVTERLESAQLETAEIIQLKQNVQTSTNELFTLLDEHENLPIKLETAREESLKLAELLKKSESLHSQCVKAVEQVRAVRNEALGYNITDENNGESKRVPGLKDELETGYTELEKDLSEAKEELQKILSLSQEKVDSFLEVNESDVNKIRNSINELLPAALTSGLSSAFGDKIDEEKKTLKEYESTFKRSISWMLGISSVPVAASAYLFIAVGTDIQTLIKDLPALTLCMMPLYFPLLWQAYSYGKKINLSKRLIEEYTHKGVLSKTYEGLSNQADKISQIHGTEELRFKLLFNLIHVNSENPGKLISDYNTADHPFMDVLDKATKLDQSLEVASKVPGIKTLAEKIRQRQESHNSAAQRSINDALNTLDKDTEYSSDDGGSASNKPKQNVA